LAKKVLDNSDKDTYYAAMALGSDGQANAIHAGLPEVPGRCQVCGAKVVIKGVDEIVIKNAILRVDGSSGRVAAKCSRCKAWVAVPLMYTG
jgi:DNA-directed RNA polymerase subunit RPC12/RpoP